MYVENFEDRIGKEFLYDGGRDTTTIILEFDASEFVLNSTARLIEEVIRPYIICHVNISTKEVECPKHYEVKLEVPGRVEIATISMEVSGKEPQTMPTEYRTTLESVDMNNNKRYYTIIRTGKALEKVYFIDGSAGLQAP